MKLGEDDKKFVEKINRAIEEERYEDLEDWEIIPTLLAIIKNYTKE